MIPSVSKTTSDAGKTVKPGASRLPHSAWLKKLEPILTAENRRIVLYEFCYDSSDEHTLSAWARHFRQQYCLDAHIDRLRHGTRLSRAEYLTTLKFPSEFDKPGPSIRSGDFSEILVADLLESVYSYFVPRTRYGDKKVKNESSKGSDVIGLKIASKDPSKTSEKDILLVVETKAKLSGRKPINRLQDAVTDSWKDSVRIAASLNSMKQRLYDLNQDAEASYVERFQDPMGKPYLQKYGAVAVFSSSVFNAEILAKTICSAHPGNSTLVLLCIHGEDLMKLAHTIYRRAADEA
ncbi:Hachiman antiphage defense system protein HamA [Bordetella bronchiseptica]|uniref:Hachiman antiphage defense system protein HamA n=1 Tax=Bordetella bronchiseptica TaxID=518 RepID=UPI000A6C2563|nr:Hachiman antiphage defense system protein HamA [Bordetella bronchiseptica]